jgi:hypothetical protein
MLLSSLNRLPYLNVRTLEIKLKEFNVTTSTQSHFEMIAVAVAQCHNLHKFVLSMLPGVTPSVDSYYFEEQYQFPPIRDLELHGYDWPYEYDAKHYYWDFSKIERLVLTHVSLRSFFINSSFPTSDLTHLKELVLGDLDGGYLVSMSGNDHEFEQMQAAADQVWQRAVNLQSLSVPDGWRVYLPTHKFSVLPPHLRELNFLLRKRNCDGPIWTEPTNEPMDLEDLTALHAACPGLQKLMFATRLSGRQAVSHVSVYTLALGYPD